MKSSMTRLVSLVARNGRAAGVVLGMTAGFVAVSSCSGGSADGSAPRRERDQHAPFSSEPAALGGETDQRADNTHLQRVPLVPFVEEGASALDGPSRSSQAPGRPDQSLDSCGESCTGLACGEVCEGVCSVCPQGVAVLSCVGSLSAEEAIRAIFDFALESYAESGQLPELSDEEFEELTEEQLDEAVNQALEELDEELLCALPYVACALLTGCVDPEFLAEQVEDQTETEFEADDFDSDSESSDDNF